MNMIIWTLSHICIFALGVIVGMRIERMKWVLALNWVGYHMAQKDEKNNGKS